MIVHSLRFEGSAETFRALARVPVHFRWTERLTAKLDREEMTIRVCATCRDPKTRRRTRVYRTGLLRITDWSETCSGCCCTSYEVAFKGPDGRYLPPPRR